MGAFRTWVEMNAEQMAEHQLEIQDRARREAEQERQRKRDLFKLRGVPMTERIQNILDLMPDEERMRPRHMSYFVNLLRSKYPTRSGADKASPAEIGPALKSLGWTRVRNWSRAEQTFHTEWRPPEKTNISPAQSAARCGNTRQPTKSKTAYSAG